VPILDAPLCRNCNGGLSPGQSYCPNCGQKAGADRLTMHEIGHDLVHAFVHVDRSFLSLFRLLLARPGHVAREYVAGKRKRYFGPFTFLVVIVGFASAFVAIFGLRVVYTNTPNPTADFLQHHINLVYLLQVPMLAAVCRVMFRRDGFNYAENLVLAAYTASMRVIVLALIAAPVLTVMHLSFATAVKVTYANSLVWLAYFGMAASQFYSGHRAVSWLKGALAAGLTFAVTQGLTTLVGVVYELIAGHH